MADKSKPKILKRLSLASLIIPVSILIASAFLSTQTVVRQMLVLVMLVWFGSVAIIGFPF